MTSPESLVLIHRATEGDRHALEELCVRYYPRWLRRFHGQLGEDLRRLCDTEDILQSGIKDALRDLRNLRSEGAFFAWVSAIMRRKIAEKRRSTGGRKPVAIEDVPEPGKLDSILELPFVTEEEYLKFLDAILELYPLYPEQMAAVYLKYFERSTIRGLMDIFGKAERSVHRLLETALGLLRTKMGLD